MKPSRMIAVLGERGLLTDKDLKEIISVCLYFIRSTKYLDSVEKEVKEICDYERAKP